MRIKQVLPIYNAPIYLRIGRSEHKKRRARTRKKSANSNLVHNLRSEFDPHRHLRRRASVRQYNSAGMISPLLNLQAEQVLLIYNTRISTNKRMICGSDLAQPTT
jgi:hypothetical protein